jgi:hypothetical protein
MGNAWDGAWKRVGWDMEMRGLCPAQNRTRNGEFVNFTSLATFLLIIANIYFGKALFRQRRDYGKD